MREEVRGQGFRGKNRRHFPRHKICFNSSPSSNILLTHEAPSNASFTFFEMAILSIPLSYVFSSYSSPSKNKKSHKVPPMALREIKKPWGPSGHPWLSIPTSGLNLRVTPCKIKIKEVKVENSFHRPAFQKLLEHILSGLSREIWRFLK